MSKESSDVLDKRKEAYDTSKTELAKEMVKRATKKGVKFSYVLGDSWFTCQSIVKFFADKRRKAHWLGMIKVGETGRTKYQTGGKSLTAHELIRLGKKQGKQEYSRKLKCFYIVVDATYGGVHVRIFLTRRTKHSKWNGLLTTDTALDFLKAWEIYSRRWSLDQGSEPGDHSGIGGPTNMGHDAGIGGCHCGCLRPFGRRNL